MSAGVALIGIGRWGDQIAAAAVRAGLRVVTCFARDEGARQAFAERNGCEAAVSAEAAMEHPGVEGVLIVTPNDVHEAHAVAAAERGRHVFVEKPIADTVAAAGRMRDACERAGVTLAVGHAFRRLGAARRVRELVDAGALGRVVLAEATFSLPGSFPPHAWRADPRRNAGGPLMQLGIHHVDTLASWLGPIASAEGRFARVATDADIDDVGVLTLAFASGALGVVTGSYVSPKTFALRLQGTEAVLDYRTDFSVWPEARALDGATTLTVAGEPVGFEERDVLADELAEFGRSIRDGVAPETGAEAGIMALGAIREAMERWAPAPR
ncbi:MAG TPA: Gfo/Idh/MocA family oxidoreductase [Solirubrobacteraceae bacterium]|nr:Gfo/Idh/MocA family oxidoreductase [Solirubrobacteraceae bacterium]